MSLLRNDADPNFLRYLARDWNSDAWNNLGLREK